MIVQAERELLVEYGKRMSREKLTAGTGGNLSIYCLLYTSRCV